MPPNKGKIRETVWHKTTCPMNIGSEGLLRWQNIYKEKPVLSEGRAFLYNLIGAGE